MSSYKCPNCWNQIWVREKDLVMVTCSACQEKMLRVKK